MVSQDVWTRGIRGPVRWTLALSLAGLWWWAALRLAIQPARAGAVEAAVAAGGWGLSLLPVHCAPKGAGRTGTRTRTRRWLGRRGGTGDGPW